MHCISQLVKLYRNAYFTTMRNIDLDCTTFFNVKKSDQYRLSDFCFEDLDIRAKKGQFDKDIVDRFVVKNVKVNSQEVR